MLIQNADHHWKSILLMWILKAEVDAAWDINHFFDKEGLAVSGWIMYVLED